MDGGRGIGAIRVVSASGTVVAERNASSPAAASASAPRPISSSKLARVCSGWMTSPASTPVRCPVPSRNVTHRIEIP